ncbi:MAG: hypothetical protein HeimC3_39180 [Candidatus Heimdallarchaeota archaeon LC_3]|nr:MAG: hypothetical protein HeimC3_39180 [Candidatus Heimdallarchaeota archaeon LC_3]
MEFFISYSVAYQKNTSDFFRNSSTLDSQIVYQSDYPIGSENSEFQEIEVINLSNITFSYFNTSVSFNYIVRDSLEIIDEEFILLGLEIGELIDQPIRTQNPFRDLIPFVDIFIILLIIALVISIFIIGIILIWGIREDYANFDLEKEELMIKGINK